MRTWRRGRATGRPPGPASRRELLEPAASGGLVAGPRKLTQEACPCLALGPILAELAQASGAPEQRLLGERSAANVRQIRVECAQRAGRLVEIEEQIAERDGGQAGLARVGELAAQRLVARDGLS